ncbi:acyl carrier protein, partial [Nocardia abscessus]|uniref:acyl carrier protein n=1 Tax=Nocardia abscessus TaxID=120957 RepID=UPI0024584B5D
SAPFLLRVGPPPPTPRPPGPWGGGGGRRTPPPAAAAVTDSATHPATSEPTAALGTQEDTAQREAAALAALVTRELAEVVGIAPDRVAVRQNFDQLGIGSVHAVELAARLTARLDIDVPAAIIWGCPTVELLAAELSTRLAAPYPAVEEPFRPPATPTADPDPAPGEEALTISELVALSRELLG